MGRLDAFERTVTAARGHRMSTGKVRVYLVDDGDRVQAATEELRGTRGFFVRRFVRSHAWSV